MNRLGYQLFSRAALALNKDCAPPWGNLGDQSKTCCMDALLPMMF